jgi:hypothetical protein
MKLAKLNSRETILMVPVYSDLANLGLLFEGKYSFWNRACRPKKNLTRRI